MNADAERRLRKIVVEELVILAKAVSGQRAANDYALESLRADQERERKERA